jgi:RimJ/RimL family protein N-acetyltransferase
VAKIETARMIARHMTMNDVGCLQEIYSDPVAMQFFPGTKNLKETTEWIEWVLQSYDEHGCGFYIWELKDSGAFAGQCGFGYQPDVDGVDEIELGGLFVRKYWGQGLASEAFLACMHYGFQELDIRRLISLVNPLNQAGRRFVEKAGFEEEKSVMRWGYEHIVYAVER